MTCDTVKTTRLPRSGIAVEIGRPVLYSGGAGARTDHHARRVPPWVSVPYGRARLRLPRGVCSSGPRPSPESSTRTHAARRAMPSSLINLDSVMSEAGSPCSLRNTRPVPSLSLCTSDGTASARPESETGCSVSRPYARQGWSRRPRPGPFGPTSPDTLNRVAPACQHQELERRDRDLRDAHTAARASTNKPGSASRNDGASSTRNASRVKHGQ